MKKHVLPFLALCFCSGCTLFGPRVAVPQTPPPSKKKVIPYPERDVRTLPFQCRKNSPVCVLSRPGLTLTFQHEKREFRCGNVLVYLNFPARFDDNGNFLLSELDCDSVIAPLVEANEKKLHPAIKTVLLDPGHGGSDLGAPGQKVPEKEMNLLLARAIADELLKRGFGVCMTRNSDKKLELDERAEMTLKCHCDYFLSVHHNSTGRDVAATRGIEVFVLTPPDGESTHGNGKTPAHRRVGNQFDKENLRIGFLIQKHLVAKCKLEDRGLKHARFRVLTKAHCPAALLEAGFVSNAAEEKRIRTAKYRRTLAAAVADALEEYNRTRK